MHTFYEKPTKFYEKALGWHLYPDGSLVGPIHVKPGYAEQWASTYRMLGQEAVAVDGPPNYIPKETTE